LKVRELKMHNRFLMVIAAIAASGLLAGCAENEGGDRAKPVAVKASAEGGTTQPAPVAASPGGAQLWADNCSRCHNIRPTQSYSDAQWEAVMMHMRLRADLTGVEQREITRFLQASH
jgi:cytochrome c5